MFGDGAGAVAVQATDDESGLVGYDLKSDGSKGGCLNLPQSNIFLEPDACPDAPYPTRIKISSSDCCDSIFETN